jgi:hypothetical protein
MRNLHRNFEIGNRGTLEACGFNGNLINCGAKLWKNIYSFVARGGFACFAGFSAG